MITTNAAEVAAAMQAIANDIVQSLPDVIEHVAKFTETTEKNLIEQIGAVDTGFMRDSVEAVKIDDLEWDVGNQADYSPLVNYGSATRPARPFAEPAFEESKVEAVDKLATTIQQIISNHEVG